MAVVRGLSSPTPASLGSGAPASRASLMAASSVALRAPIALPTCWPLALNRSNWGMPFTWKRSISACQRGLSTFSSTTFSWPWRRSARVSIAGAIAWQAWHQSA